jgi:hypothetical protein
MEKAIKLAKDIQDLNTGKVFLLVFNNQPNQKMILDLNREGQLRFGTLEDGSKMPLYSRTSQVVFGKPNTNWTLYDTGDFYRSFKITGLTENAITWTGDTQKDDVDLADKVANATGGGIIFGLTDESKEILIKEVLPSIRKLILKQLNL